MSAGHNSRDVAMKMKPTLSRRMFLRGAAGFTLPMPFLGSLLKPATARADGGPPRRFIAFATEHGGIWPEYMHPPDAALTDKMTYAGHEVRRGALAPTMANGITTLSPVVSGSSSRLTPTLVSKMNLLRGLDLTWYLSHHRGGHLGNVAEHDPMGEPADGPVVAIPTIDQVMAWSPTFYPDPSGIRERSLIMGSGKLSSGWSSPTTKSGTVQTLNAETNSLTLFNRIFVPATGSTTPTRPSIVDQVLADYQRIRNSNRRLSGDDKRRLDDHVSRLSELQRKLTAVNAMSCSGVAKPSMSSSDVKKGASTYGENPAKQAQFWELFNDVIVAALSCDTSRVATMRVEDTFSTFSGDWHQSIAHEAAKDADAHTTLYQAHQKYFEGVVLDLIAKLDAVQESDGMTLLDHSLVQWTQESGVITHDQIDLPIVTAGSAGGFLRTGNYVDYRNLNKTGQKKGSEGFLVGQNTGLIYNQWLGNVLQAMGVPRTEYETEKNGGYGHPYMAGSNTSWFGGYNKYGTAELSVMGEILPFLR